MKRPLAMRATQEQFDSIKDKLVYDNVSDFKKYSYLCNFYYDKIEVVTNTGIPQLVKGNHEIHETFNADIFLEACGIEVEKVWRSNELEYYDDPRDKWTQLGDGSSKIRIKPQPNYDKEIEALQQKAKENGMKVIINFEKL